MTAAIICNGSISDFDYHRRLVKDCSLIICADGGALYAKKMNINPHVIIGDFDSCKREYADSFTGAKVIGFPSEKDETDAHLAVEYALSQGEKHIILLGAIGTRLDHTLVNLGLLQTIKAAGGKGEIINEYNRVSMVEGSDRVKGKGALVSLVPFGGDVRGLTLRGFKYPLEDFTLRMGSSRGVSNVLLEDTGYISVRDGTLLMIQSRD